MDLNLSLKRRDQALASLEDIYSRAKHYKMSHAALMELRLELSESLTKAKVPHWIITYLDGAERVLSNNLYKYDLEYCSFAPDGTIVSHYRKSPRYYETLGYSPESVCNKNIKGGHYWKDTDKPFFAYQDKLNHPTLDYQDPQINIVEAAKEHS